MCDGTRRDPELRTGYALLSVFIFALIIFVVAFAMFMLVSYESIGALYRQESSEAFYLADGAVERARAKFLNDMTWREGWVDQTAGRGDYDLFVRDTTYQGDNAVQLIATGHVGRATRCVEVLADIPPTAWELVMLIMGDADVNGNLCLPGSAHVNGEADFGPNDVFLKCGGCYTEGFVILPPPIYTDPEHFPNATYYYVRGDTTGGIPQARIFNCDLEDITGARGDSLFGQVTFDPIESTYDFTFLSEEVDHYFNDSTGVFRKDSGDIAAVVNFGEAIGNPPDIRTNIHIHSFDVIRATIINTRFTGVTDEERIDYRFWFGGMTELQHACFEPRYGIALIPYDFMKPGGALVQIGTADWPALVYVTADVENINANLNLVGSIIVLGDWKSEGGPDFIYNAGFIDNLPDYLVDEWIPGASGTLKILCWREIAVASP